MVASLPAQPDELVRRRTVQPSRRLAQVSATQRRAAVRPPVSSEKNYDDYEDSEVAASDSYGAYDDTHSQFEKGVQSQADSYSTDKVTFLALDSKFILYIWRKFTSCPGQVHQFVRM